MVGDQSITAQPRTKRLAFLPYLVTAFAAALLVGLSLHLWQANLRVPLDYEMLPKTEVQRAVLPGGGGDSYFSMMVFKTIQETGWCFTNDRLGAPLGMDLHDHPITDSLQVAIAWLLCHSTGDCGLAINLFFLLGFPLSAMAAHFGLRRLGIPHALAIACGLLYGFLPYHFLRGQGHLFLGFYAVVPLTCVVAIWIAKGDGLLRSVRPGIAGFRLTGRGWVSVVVMLLTACSGAYYALFGLYLVAVAGAIAIWQRPGWRSVLSAGLSATVLCVTLGLNVLPFVLYRASHGVNSEVLARDPAHAEIYALKPAQLIVPLSEHRLPILASLGRAYEQKTILLNENRMAALGVVGAVGLLLLLAWLIGLRWRSRTQEVLETASCLNASLMVLGTVGGLGSLLAFGISPVIRSYNRVSVMIAFFAFMAVGAVVNALIERYVPLARRPFVLSVAALLIVGIGVMDETSPAFLPLHRQNAQAYASDAEFVHRLETSLPPNAAIFQLPYIAFPEGGTQAPYEHLRPYLHSSTLRWSFGCVRGRPGSQTICELAAELTKEPTLWLGHLRQAGYSGVWLDRIHPDSAGIERSLRRLIPSEPIESSDKRQVFFTLPT